MTPDRFDKFEGRRAPAKLCAVIWTKPEGQARWERMVVRRYKRDGGIYTSVTIPVDPRQPVCMACLRQDILMSTDAEGIVWYRCLASDCGIRFYLLNDDL